MPSSFLLRWLDWFIPAQARTDEATLGRARIFAFTHLVGPAMGLPVVVGLIMAGLFTGKRTG